MEAMEVFSLLSRVHLGPEDLLNSSSLKEVPLDHHETLFSNARHSRKVGNTSL